MGDESNHSLAERIERLERSNQEFGHRLERAERRNRHLKRLCTAMLASTLVLAVGGARFAADHSVVEAERFVLRDKEGNSRGTFTIGKDGTPGFALLDEHGEARIALWITPEGEAELTIGEGNDKSRLELGLKRGRPHLILCDPDQQARLNLALAEDHAPYVTLADQRQNDKVVLQLSKTGAAGLAFIDKDGHGRVAVVMNSDGSPRVELRDEKETERVKLIVAPGGGAASLFAADKDGKPRIAMSMGPDDAPALRLVSRGGRDGAVLRVLPNGETGLGLYDQEGRLRAILGTSTEGEGGLEIFDANGDGLFQAPAR